MQVSITEILGEGVSRTTKRNGLILIGIVFVLAAINSLISLDLGRQSFGGGRWYVLLAVTFVIALVLLAVHIAAIRVFVSEETKRLPSKHFTHNMGWTMLNFIIGAIIFWIIVTIGLLLLVVPGLFLLTALAFWAIYVAAEGVGFMEGFKKSWGLTRGHRLNLFILGVVVVILMAIVSAIFGFLGGLISPTSGRAIGSALGGAVTGVFTVAALAATYNRLTALSDGDSGTTVDDREGVASPDDASGSI